MAVDTLFPVSVKVLFVCSGNVLRSPVAAAFFRKRVAEMGREGDFEAESAGTATGLDDSLDPRVIGLVGEMGAGEFLDLQPRQLSREEVKGADVIVAMEEEHRRAVLSLDTAAEGRIEVWGVSDRFQDFDRELPGWMGRLKERTEALAEELAERCK